MRAADAVAAARAQLDRLPFGVVCASPDGVMVFANRRIEDMVGPVLPGVPASRWAEAFGLRRTDGTAYADEREIPVIRALHQGDVRDTMRSRDGTDSVVLDSTASAVIDASGRCIGSIGIFRPAGGPSRDPASARGTPGRSARTGALANEAEPVLLLAGLHLAATCGGPEPVTVARRAAELIDERYAEPWTLELLARTLSVSPVHLTSEVSQLTGRGAMRLLAETRVERAKVLLAGTSWPIAQVGKAVGLPDGDRFARTFRRHADSSPMAYRAAATQEWPETP